jgi:hypothetical protein
MNPNLTEYYTTINTNERPKKGLLGGGLTTSTLSVFFDILEVGIEA